MTSGHPPTGGSGRAWHLHPKVPSAARLSAELDLHPELVSILVRRGHADASSITRFLDPEPSTLQDPFIFRDMAKAVERLRLAGRRRERVLVYGDYDMDGVSACAVLLPALLELGADAEAHLPDRVRDGYGLRREPLERLLAGGFSVVVTVDNGLTQIDAVRFLTEKGIDVIVVDHHLPKDVLPPAFAIVSAAVGPGDPDLAACGLAFKLVWALRGSYAAAEECLDLVALGTVADVAGVAGENRILLKKGLELLRRTRRPGLRALLRSARLGRSVITYRDLAFALVPRLNAAGRMGSAGDALRLLTATDEAEAGTLARALEKGNRDRQRVEASIYAEAVRQADGILVPGDAAVVVAGEDWHEGVIGIVAARLAERYRRPAIVIALKAGKGKGSGRSLPSIGLLDAVAACEELLVEFGGHSQALGLTIRSEQVGPFRSRLNEALRSAGPGRPAGATLEIEGEIAPAELDLRFLKDLERLAPFGPGHRRPVFLTRGMRLRGEPARKGKDTLHAWMSDSAGKTVCEVVGFRMFERWLKASPKKKNFDVVHQPALTERDGIASIQLELEDWS